MCNPITREMVDIDERYVTDILVTLEPIDESYNLSWSVYLRVSGGNKSIRCQLVLEDAMGMAQVEWAECGFTHPGQLAVKAYMYKAAPETRVKNIVEAVYRQDHDIWLLQKANDHVVWLEALFAILVERGYFDEEIMSLFTDL